MGSDLILIDRAVLLAELQKAFDVKTAEVLLGVLDKVAAQVRAAGVTRGDFSELRQIVSNLAASQERLAASQERMAASQERLEAAQERTEKRIDELAEAQKRTEEQLKRLAEAQEDLALAQKRTEDRVDKLAEAIDQLRRQVGGLSETVGGDIEDIAYIVLHDVLKREFGWEVRVLERTWQTWDDEPEEVNVFGTAIDPARPEAIIWIIGEAKHNLTINEVKRFMQQVDRARKHLMGEIFPVCFCYRARPEVQQQIRDAEIRLVFSYGKLV